MYCFFFYYYISNWFSDFSCHNLISSLKNFLKCKLLSRDQPIYFQLAVFFFFTWNNINPCLKSIIFQYKNHWSNRNCSCSCRIQWEKRCGMQSQIWVAHEIFETIFFGWGLNESNKVNWFTCFFNNTKRNPFRASGAPYMFYFSILSTVPICYSWVFLPEQKKWRSNKFGETAKTRASNALLVEWANLIQIDFCEYRWFTVQTAHEENQSNHCEAN